MVDLCDLYLYIYIYMIYVRDLNQDKKKCHAYITCINKIKSTLKQ